MVVDGESDRKVVMEGKGVDRTGVFCQWVPKNVVDGSTDGMEKELSIVVISECFTSKL